MIPIYIPTRGTVTKTYDNLPDSIKKSVIMFTDNIVDSIPLDQQLLFKGGIANKRQACIDHAIKTNNEHMVLVDDDALLYKVIRNEDGTHKAAKELADEESYKSFYVDAIQRFVDDDALTIISDHSRAFINGKNETNSNLNKFCIHDLAKVKKSGCVYNRITIFEDIDFYLQLFRAGYSVRRTKIISSINDSSDYVDMSPDKYTAVFLDWQEHFHHNVKITWDTASIFAGNKRVPVTVNIKWKPMVYETVDLNNFLE